ncbi:OmpA family protein [Bacteroides pyogenes]|uniref:OmpA family protein n=1 Tax=Bacteroides pyogenes TaxID=310300 RepID=UPI001BACF344|nr:OmpA family protein [Bacteroides pyogenes]MBR8706586.1 Peptidoglycan-associated lipoprotein [Bacteroides pyogenes]
MKKLIYLLLFALVATTLVGCGGKSEGKTALHEMEKIVEKAEKDKGILTADEWKALALSFEENENIVNKAVENKQIGVEGRMKFIALTARWAAASGEMMMAGIFSKLNEVLKPEEEAAVDSVKEVTDGKRWIVYYKDIVLGNQGNKSNGHFLKLKTGETVTVDEAKGQEEFLAMLIFTEKGYMKLTFPAHAEEASVYKEFNTNRLFSQKPGGVQSWPAEKMSSGMFREAKALDPVEFNKLAKFKAPAHFDELFRKNNKGDEKLQFEMQYVMNPVGGKIYLVQLNNLVRCILLVKSVKTAENGSLAFEIIAEGRQDFTDIDMARFLQPDEPLGTETANADEIRGKVTDCKTGNVIGGVTIQFEDRESEKIQTVVSNNAGEFSFVPDPTIRELEARGKKNDYMSRVVNIGSVDFERYKSQGVLLEICMEKVDYDKALRLDNIHYDTGKADIRPDARPDLDRLVQFLKDNPEVKVELSSHTDSRADADYNLKLSQRRADEAKKYIVSKGISDNRIVAVGYGETRLLNRCVDGVECSEEEHQLNRRTEIKMIK